MISTDTNSDLLLVFLFVEKAKVKVSDETCLVFGIVLTVLILIFTQEQVFAYLMFNVVGIVAELG